MNDDRDTQHLDFRHLAADIVAAYVSNNHVQAADLPTLLASVHAAVQVAAEGETSAVVASPVEKPSAAEIRRSVGRDALISFEDGKPYKTLKRHLTGRGLTPEQYREKWGLPRDYPLVAPDYAERRSLLAKAIGLGRPNAAADEPKTRGRKKTA
ncbi:MULTISPECIES: MucR family transcriptional regulator [unclassified Methylobacterium]|uniref:MucR family transcriptional regulator n=1 Tax=unclassified Methylobacterium TaxID=2615210 RepID=UPI0011C1F7BC|nr:MULTISPECIES: MucR family transcriptional regulator [unclassified Methylobacterium]QEE42327.1 MucR family transcriptional regulator [Methylobacterium sp. WL1]TXN59728.1 MucR family transcriptional regulator [Methylobacterium sp. WL2]